MKALGLVLQALRKQKGLTQVELAEAADVAQASVSRAERGTPITVDSVTKIAEGLGTSASVLMHKASLVENDLEALEKAEKALEAAIERVLL